jgi:hypothetical protein
MKDTFTFGTGAISVALLLVAVAGTGVTALIATTYAQTELGEPFFQESGKITGQKEMGPGEMQISYTANGTFKGNVEVTNNGDFVSTMKGGNLTFGQGQGTMTSADGSETANYTFIGVGNVTEEGKPVFLGATAYSTDSPGELSFLNNVLGIFKVEIDKTGSFVGNEWEWK